MSIVKKDDIFVVQINDIAIEMQDEIEGLQLTFDRVRIPLGGGLSFEIPSETGEPELVNELVGVIVDHHPINVYWEGAYTIGQTDPPDCSSMDGKQGFNVKEGEVRDCKTCPYNQFGSAETGKGKACKNKRRIYLLQSGELLPIQLTLPPTSLKPFSDYIFKRLLTKGYKTCDVITKITLKRVQAYSQAHFSLVAPLEEETKIKMRSYAENIKAMTRQLSEDYEEEEIPF